MKLESVYYLMFETIDERIQFHSMCMEVKKSVRERKALLDAESTTEAKKVFAERTEQWRQYLSYGDFKRLFFKKPQPPTSAGCDDEAFRRLLTKSAEARMDWEEIRPVLFTLDIPDDPRRFYNRLMLVTDYESVLHYHEQMNKT